MKISFLDRRHHRFNGSSQPGGWLEEYTLPQTEFIEDTVFILPAKTGCTSIRHAINTYRDEKLVRGETIKSSRHLSPKELKKKAIEFPSIMTVRHPFERVVSAFFNKFSQPYGGNIDRFLEEVIQVTDFYADIHIQSMTFLSKNIQIDRLIRQEDMEEDYNKAREVAPWLPRHLPHSNKTGTGTKWKDYLTPEWRGPLYKRYKEDFETFNYGVL